MAFAPFRSKDKVLGCFRERSVGNIFEFSRGEEKPFWETFPLKVWVAANDFRWARVHKTVAHVVVDEDAEGKPVVEKWDIKGQKVY